MNTSATETIDDFLTNETTLVTDLLKDYNKLVGPVSVMDRSNNQTVEKLQVNITVVYAKLIELNETESTVRSYSTLFVQYKDARLQWDPAKYNGIQLVLLNKMVLWYPNIALESGIEEIQMRASEAESIVVFYNGTCASSFTGVVKLLCSFNLRLFPFDTQMCALKLLSVNYLDTEIDLRGTLSPTFSYDDMNNGEWTFINMGAYSDYYVNPFTNWSYPTAVFEMTISRSATYYMVLIIIPSFILNLLTVFSMFWSCISRENYIRTISLGFSSELSQLTLLQIGSLKIPKSNKLPALSSFFLWNICILAASIFAVLLTSKLKYRFPVPEGSIKRRHRLLGLMYCYAHGVFLLVFGLCTLVNFVKLIGLK